MQRDYRLYLHDIIDNAASIAGALAGVSYEEYVENRLLQAAVERFIEILGEAVKRLPEEMKAQDEADWKMASKMRDVLAHDYPNIVIRIIWDTAVNDVPRLATLAQRILDEMPHQS